MGSSVIVNRVQDVHLFGWHYNNFIFVVVCSVACFAFDWIGCHLSTHKTEHILLALLQVMDAQFEMASDLLVDMRSGKGERLNYFAVISNVENCFVVVVIVSI